MSHPRSPHGRKHKSKPAHRNTRASGNRSYERPRIDPQLKRVFKQIGVPDSVPFVPDPFQVEALDRVRETDVLVSAPTGAGKTWIATEEIKRRLAHGRNVWYASPLKALSNNIYQQFQREFGSGLCGILTGDRKENPDAQVIVGTTEILRNQLYDAMHKGASIRADLVILDEAHYLSDPDRGVVWEETLIYLPARVRLLLLSATIPNAQEVAAWLEKIREAPACVVKIEKRPVPLKMLFLFPDGLISPLGDNRGVSGRIKKFMAGLNKMGFREKRRLLDPDYGEVIRCLRALDLLPAIFFLKSRADCDSAVQGCPATGAPRAVKERARAQVSAFIAEHPNIGRSRQLKPLMESLVGAHHAGQLPIWKLLVEKMMEKGLLEAIFSTSTVAAGVNFPARSVVLVQSDRFDGTGFRDLSARDLHQMVGRAGRRGKDRIGFGIVLPGPHQDPVLVNDLCSARPEPLTSRIHINFSMTLNLLLSHKPIEIRTLLEKSFASFQRGEMGSQKAENWDRLVESLTRQLIGGHCDTGDPLEVLELIDSREKLRRRSRAQEREKRNRLKKRAFGDFLSPGRLFLHKKGGLHLVFQSYMENGNLICEALNLEKPIRTKGGRVRLRKVRLERVKFLFTQCLELPQDWSLKAVEEMLEKMPPQELDMLEPESPESTGEGAESQGHLKLPCDSCPHFKDCHTPQNRRFQRVLRELRVLSNGIEGMSQGLWLSFRRHLRFLKDTGFVDQEDRLTPDGEWASRLRLDHPLLIAEAIRQGAFHDVTSELLAGSIAPFVWDRAVEVLIRPEPSLRLEEMEALFDRLLDSIEGIRALKAARGFENPEVLFWPSVALFLWAGGIPWDRLLEVTPVDEGDMASLIIRTADHLRQVAGLRDTHPDLAARAEEAVELILREPAFLEE